MAATIQIKRGTSGPINLTHLLDGELAYDKDNNKLYIGKDGSKTVINSVPTAAEVGADPSGSANTALTNAKAYTDTALSTAKSYTDTSISNLINSAPTTLDTLGEIATAMADNAEVVEALETSIGNKADKSAIPTKVSQLTNDSGYKTTDTNTTYTISKSGSTITLTGSDGTTSTVTDSDTNTTYSAATTSANGLMTSAMVTKLNGIATGAEVNQNAFSNVTVGSTTIAADGKADTLTLVAGSNVTLTPDATNDKITIAATDTVYTHPTSAGNKHIPAGGSSGQILRWSAAGTAAWGADNNTTYSNATQSAAGLMSAADKTKLDGIATGANNYTYTLPTASSSTLGGVKTTSTVTSNSGYTACPIISGVPYYKDTNTTYTLPTATASVLGGVKIGSNITVSSGTISLSKANVTAALGYTPPTTNTTYSVATTSANGLMSSSDKTKLNGIATGAQVNNVVVSTSTPTASTAEVWINPNGQTTITNVANRVTALEADTGWQNLSLASGVSAIRARIRRKNGVVYCEIINLTGWTKTNAVCTIPDGFRPDTSGADNSYRWAAPTTGANWTRPEISSAGVLCIYTTTTTEGAWTDFVATWIAAGY